SNGVAQHSGSYLRQRSHGRSQFLSGRGLLSRRAPAATRTCNLLRMSTVNGLGPRPSTSAAVATAACYGGGGGGSGDDCGGGGGGNDAIRTGPARHSASLAEVGLLPSCTAGGGGVAITAAAGAAAVMDSNSLTACTMRWSAAEWPSSDDGYYPGGGHGFGGSSGMRPYMWSGASRTAAQDSVALISETSIRHSMERNSERDRDREGSHAVRMPYNSVDDYQLAASASSRALPVAAVASNLRGSLISGHTADGIHAAVVGPLRPLMSIEAHATQRVRQSFGRPSPPGPWVTPVKDPRGPMCKPGGLTATRNVKDTLFIAPAAAANSNCGADAGAGGGGGGDSGGGGASPWWVRLLRSAGLSCAFRPTRGLVMSPGSGSSSVDAGM
ncbi:hypothetical protein Vretifemale_15909, partial [Volvox reticuliferus]